MKEVGAAIAPNIFDAFAETRLLLPLVLGNLLSQNLWDFSARIQARLAPAESETGLNEDPLKFIRAIQRQLDRQFKHLHANEVSQIYGELNLEDERARLGPESVNCALKTIESGFRQRMSEGAIPREAIEPLLERIKLGYFPAFFYGNVDIVLANKRLSGRKSSAPMGITSCLDETALFSALAMTMPGASVANVIALTSASHYTAFGWTPAGDTWWFYGKNKLYSRQEWSDLVEQQFNGDPQQAFDGHFKDMSRIVCVTGTFDLLTGETEISQEHLVEIIDQLDLFFGVRLSQVRAGLSKPFQNQDASALAPVLRDLLGSQSLERTRHSLLTQQDPSLLQPLYSYRSLELVDLRPYLWVARHQPLSLALGHSLRSRQEAVNIVKSIEAYDSIFKDRNRIAMPDETLRLKTGSDRDKALLLHVLLEHMAKANTTLSQVETLFTTEDTFVCTENVCLSLQTFSEVARPTSGVYAQWSERI